MSSCLVTTLKEPVSDVSLLKLGDFRFSFIQKEPNIKVFVLALHSIDNNNTVEIEVKSPGYITNEEGTANLGQTATVGRTGVSICLIPGNYDVVIHNKYNLEALTWWDNYLNDRRIMGRNAHFDLSDLTYCPINDFRHGLLLTPMVEKLSDLPKVGFFKVYASGSGVTGDLAEVSTVPTNTNAISIHDTDNLTGDLSTLSGLTVLREINFRNTKITGNLSSLSGLTQMTTIQLEGASNIQGALSSLASLTNLTTLELDKTQVTGDTSSLANLTNLTTFTYTNTAITGTWPLV